jgi:hypothetical protein
MLICAIEKLSAGATSADSFIMRNRIARVLVKICGDQP